MNQERDPNSQPDESLERLGRRLSEVVHDLRNPLGSILALSEVLERDCSNEQREVLEQLRTNANICNELVDDVLYFSTSRRAPVRPLDPAELIRATLASRPDRFPKIRVTSQIRGKDRQLLSRASDLRRLILNLVRNAEDAMASAGLEGRIEVAVTTAEDDEGVKIEVIDEGPGFPEAILRGDAEVEGLGLGICRRIALEHRGRFELANRSPSGSRILITLRDIDDAPLVEDKDGKAAKGSSTDDESLGDAAPLNILVVDDDPNICSTYTRVLSLDDHHVDVRQSGREGLELLIAGDYDVALVDVRLPDLSGTSFFAELRERRPEIADRVVFATGDVRSEETLEFLKSSGNRYLIKPFEIAELRAALRDTSNQEKESDMTREEFAEVLRPLARDLTNVDLSDGPAAAQGLAASHPLDSEAIQDIRSKAVAGMEAGWLLPKEAGEIRFGRVAKDLEGFSVDAVWMSSPGPRHRHPNGEIDLCFTLDGDATFDGQPEGWVCYPADSRHVPTVANGTMLILYFLPGGAIEFE